MGRSVRPSLSHSSRTGRGFDIRPLNNHHVVLLVAHGRRHVMQELYSTRVENVCKRLNMTPEQFVIAAILNHLCYTEGMIPDLIEQGVIR